MILYDYKCDKCGQVKEFTIETGDISGYTNQQFSIDQEKLNKRIFKKRKCECGGDFKKVFSSNHNIQFGEYAKQRHQ